MNKPTCFISYCHSDIDRDVLEFVIAEIQTHSQKGIDFYFDEDVPFGKRFNDFMSQISSVDVILVFLTPDYKTKTIERTGGVYTEYKKIVEKFDEGVRANLESSRDDFVSVIPIIISGTRDSSMPEALRDARSLNLSELIVRRTSSGRLQISEDHRSKFEHHFKKIAAQIIVKDALHTEAFRKTEDQYYDELFVKLKAGEKSIPKSVLLETASYKLVQTQTAFFVIGRKGSGKSTLARMLELINKNSYNGFIGIRAENINLQQSYNQITHGRESDS
ncbi:MAG: TIR domain-containing protein [Limisphaerales bacterium]